MQIQYVTARNLENSKGEEKGKARILKLVGEREATVDFTCPECSFSENRKESWLEPFVIGNGANKKFNIKCSKCGFSVELMKLKKEIKKKK